MTVTYTEEAIADIVDAIIRRGFSQQRPHPVGKECAGSLFPGLFPLERIQAVLTRGNKRDDG